MRKFGSGVVLGAVFVAVASGSLVALSLAAEVALTPENTKIAFLGTKPGGKHDGGFRKFTGTIDLAKAKIVVEIDTESLYSDNPKLTNHLKTADFFEVRKFPKATFTATSITPTKGGNATHTVTGDLTLHGVKKTISFPATISEKGGTLTLNSKFTINKVDFGMTYGQGGKINDDVTIMVTVNAKGK